MLYAMGQNPNQRSAGRVTAPMEQWVQDVAVRTPGGHHSLHGEAAKAR